MIIIVFSVFSTKIKKIKDMSEDLLKEKILKAIKSIPEDAFSEKTKPLNDPDIKKLINEKIAQGISIAKIHASISPNILEISDTYFRRWLKDLGMIKRKKKKQSSGKQAKEGRDGA
tara:strand:- start:348 stop:695 length:348 start_codon:yes stop_codon:yes gene_type:complete